MTSGDSASSTVVNDTKRTEATPDASAAGFLDHAPNPLRYDGQPNDPDEVVGVLSSLIPQGSRVLDVGCGTGSVSIQLIANRGLSLIGVEPDEERAQRARDRGVTVRAARLTPELIAELGSFDVVLFADVLEHLPDPHSLLTLATSALRPGGRVVASVPNVAHWSVRTDLLRGRFVEWQRFPPKVCGCPIDAVCFPAGGRLDRKAHEHRAGLLQDIFQGQL